MIGAARLVRSSKIVRSRRPAAIERIELRQLLSATLDSAFSPVLATTSNPSADSIGLLSHISDPNILGTVVQFDTTEGNFRVTLTDSATPATVANFLKYVNSGAYKNTFFHRSVVLTTNKGGSPTHPADIVQGGGYKIVGRSVQHIPTNAPVADEYTTELFGDVAGTLAMAKTSSANSATSEFFFNEHDTSSELDTPTTDSSGATTSYTVFGKVLGDGMNVIDKLATLPTVDASKGNSALNTLPVAGIAESAVAHARVHPNNLVYLKKVEVINTDSGMTFTATNDNPGLVQPKVAGSSLSFSYAVGQTGSAGITVTGTSIDGTSIAQTFTVTVPSTTATAPVAANDTVSAVTAVATPLNLLTNDTSNAALDPSTLAITTQPASGTAQVDAATGIVTYTANAGFTGTDTFAYTISDTSGAVSSPATVTINVVAAPVQTTIGDKTARVLRFTRPDGTVATLHISGGTAAVTFAGPVVTTSTKNGIVTASGTDATIAGIVVTNSVKRDAALSVSTNGKSHIATIGTITDTGNLRSITGNSLSLTGDLTVGGLGALNVGSTNGATINIGGGLVSPTIKIATATNTSIASTAAIGHIVAGSFNDTTGLINSISAPSVANLNVGGGFSDSLNLNSAANDLDHARIKGALGGSWILAGSMRNLSAKSAGAAWGITANSSIASIALGGDLTGAVTASQIGMLKVGGSITGASVTTNGIFSSTASQLHRLHVGGSITNSAIISGGNVGTIMATSLTGSQLYAGVTSAVTSTKALPTTATNFDSDATIIAVNLRAHTAAFSNSVISAQNIRSLNLGTVVTANNGTADGVAAKSLSHLTAKLDSNGQIHAGKHQLKSATTFAAYVAKNKLALHDFAVDIVTAG